jgi:hypothetical protein
MSRTADIESAVCATCEGSGEVTAYLPSEWRQDPEMGHDAPCPDCDGPAPRPAPTGRLDPVWARLKAERLAATGATK